MSPVPTTLTMSVDDMCELEKVLERSGGKPVAILRNSALVGYFVPAEAVEQVQYRYATREEVMESLARRRAVNQPVLDWLRDK